MDGVKLKEELQIFEQIQKRDGRIVKFDAEKITLAIYKAGKATGEFGIEEAEELTQKVLDLAKERIKEEIPTVEQIQDIVEEVLMESPYKKTAKAYILYRQQHAEIREMLTKGSLNLVEEYLKQLDWKVRENSNMTFSLQGLHNYVSSEIIKIYWLNKVYPQKIKQAHIDGDFHIHDLNILSVYTYFGKEVIIAKYKNEILLLSFEQLYDIIPEKERLLNKKDEAYAKYPKNLYVLDKKGFVKVTRIVRKKKDKRMFFIKNRGGRSVIVTEDHPMITKDGFKQAKYIKEGKDLLYTVDIPSTLKKYPLFKLKEIDILEEILKKGWKGPRVYFESLPLESYKKIPKKDGTLHTITFSIPRKIKLTQNFGYAIGVILSEGYLSYDEKSSITVPVSSKNKKILLDTAKGLKEAGFVSYLEKRKSIYELKIKNPFLKFLLSKVFNIKPRASRKTLPEKILLYNKDFVKGVIGGIIDGDGSIDTCKTRITIRVSSRTMLEQLSVVLSLLGFTPRDRNLEGEGSVRYYKEREIKQNYPLYGLSFRKINVELPSQLYKKCKLSSKAWHDEEKDAWHKVINCKPTKIKDEYIYDITTSSHTLIVNLMWNHNCVGWDLQDLLLQGFRGAQGKVESRPPKHFRSALGQIVNFLYTLQGEAAGAQAVSNIDTLLAPFIRYDGLDYKQVKQGLQEWMYNMNVPTRVGFQCVSEDTEILTYDGWKNYKEVKKGDKIYTFNIKNKNIELQIVKSVFKRRYKGVMYRLKNRIQDQLISPRHRVVRRKFNTSSYVLEPIEDVLKLNSPIIIPIAGKNPKKDVNIPDEQIKLMAWIIAEGTIERPSKYRCCYRISIYQSKRKNPKNYKEIKSLLNYFNLKYSEYESIGLGEPVVRFRLNAESSKVIHKWFGTKENIHFIPKILLNLSERQSKIFLETYLKADGFEDCKIAVSDPSLLDDLQRIIINAGWGFTVNLRKPAIGKKSIYVLRIIKHNETYITKIEKVHYEGIIWCPHTKNETIIARRNGKVFITGNTPFSNITLDLKPSPLLAKQKVIIGGKFQDATYEEFQKEIDMFNKALLEVYSEGDAKGRVFTFPIPTYNISKDFDFDNENLKGLWEITAKYGIPYFANFINSDLKPEDARSMCCRLRLDKRELKKRGGGLFGSDPLTGSIGVVTINMPRLGYLSKNETEFFQRLEELMELAKDSLEIKREVLEKLTEGDLYPYAKFYLRNIKASTGEYWKNHFSTIGLVGMNEACLNLLGVNIASEEGRKFAIKVLDFMRSKISNFQEQTGNLYNLEATPAEGTSYRLARIDKRKFKDIIVANEEAVKRGAEPYYTNSTQLPVNYTQDVFEALELQDDIQVKYTGGTVLHIFVGERINNPEIVKELVKKISYQYKLPYFTITPTFSICPEHGYISGEHFKCPKCEKNCEVYSRIVGYLRPVHQWNDGKREEFKMRKTFNIK